MRLALFILIGLLLALPGQAQERLRNVRIRVVDSSRLEILYDLLTTRPGDSAYVQVQSRTRGVLRILPEFVRGDIGVRITAGSDRRIIWEALANGYALNEDVRATVLVKTNTSPAPVVLEKPIVGQQPSDAPAATVTASEPASITLTAGRSRRKRPSSKPPVLAADPVETKSPQPQLATPVTAAPQPSRPEIVQPVPSAEASPVVPADSVPVRKVRYAGPAWALLSIVAPGIGNVFVQTPKPKIGLRPLVTIGCYGLLAYGLGERQKAQDSYALYEQQKNMTVAEPYYQTANDHHHRYFLATRGALIVAAADVVLTVVKGLRNGRRQREEQRSQSFQLLPGLQAGQPTAVVRYTF